MPSVSGYHTMHHGWTSLPSLAAKRWKRHRWQQNGPRLTWHLHRWEALSQLQLAAPEDAIHKQLPQDALLMTLISMHSPDWTPHRWLPPRQALGLLAGHVTSPILIITSVRNTGWRPAAEIRSEGLSCLATNADSSSQACRHANAAAAMPSCDM